VFTADDPLPRRPRRVIVAGVSGCGKTTLAARIALLTGGAHTEIDGLYHGAGWTPRPEFLDDVTAFTALDSWTTEWQYSPARPLLADRADLMVWMDLPFLRVTLPRVIHRTLRRRRLQEQLWNGNVEPPLRTIFTDPEHIIRWAITTRNKYRERVPRLEADHPHLVVVRLRTTAEIERWMSGPLRHALNS
jgi:adenylate kinase family enzyme